MSRGHDRERDLIELMEADGWVCVRSAGSLGPVDVVAIREAAFVSGPHGWGRYSDVRLIEVKSTHRGPFHGFPPADRKEMLEFAERAGAEAWLAWWPPCKPGQRKLDALKWIPSRDWPKIK